ncbi:MAG: M23 family metallopeptidase [Oscillospiraceae bacterium]|jgi:murein DD-endopeptidase MepM/ murein hydrolase activator NlpD|nr:M23 family metallopeptidase [Oscillospiraceae bacterium]
MKCSGEFRKKFDEYLFLIMPKLFIQGVIKIMVNKSKKRGFYIALSVCVLAVCAAGWSTYKSVIDFVAPSSSIEPSNKTSENSKKEEISKKNVSKEPKPLEGNKKTDISEKNEVLEVSSKPIATDIIFPVEGGKTLNNYSKDKLVESELKDWRIHNGVDITAKLGSEIKSITDGKVKNIYSDENFGKTVVVESKLNSEGQENNQNILEFNYSGLDESKVHVEKDQIIKKGTVIGEIGEIPTEKKSPHLHLTIKKNKQYVDPSDIVPQDAFSNNEAKFN